MENQEIKNELLKLTPPAGVSVTTFMGVSLSDWVYIATIIYIGVQCVCIVLKTIKTLKNKGDEENNG
mgnify:CR=1 FL=1